MKKVLFAAVALVAMLSAASCSKSDKCKCTYETSLIKQQTVEVSKPEDKKCSELTSSDINVLGVKIDATGLVDVKCSNN